MSSSTAILSRIAAQLHIRAHPPPKNLHESRQILLALQKFGEVHVFRSLKYDTGNKKPNRKERPIVAILESAEAAQQAIASSPITVKIPSPPPDSNSNSSLSSPSPTSTPDPNTEPTTITCAINPSRQNHERIMRRNPFFLVYDIDKDTPIYADMTSPETAVPLKELADVLQRGKMWKKRYVKPQTQRTTAKMGAYSLRELWKEGLDHAEAERVRAEEEQIRAAKTGLRRVSLAHIRESGAGLEEHDGR